MAATAVIGGVGLGLSAMAMGQNSRAQRKNQANEEQQLKIQTQQSYLQGLNSIRDYDKSIADMEGAKIQYGIDIRDANSRIDSYDKWLGNYGAMYQQEVQSKQAQTDSLMASGKETYENFLNAIGYADAAAGATGRVGAGTSMAHTTQMLDQKLVDYVGADRKLDAQGGLFGSQLTAANMEMGQLKVDLDFQRQEMVANRQLVSDTVQDWNKAISLTDKSIQDSTKSRNELENFINKNFNSDYSTNKKPNVFNDYVRPVLDPADIFGWL